MVPLTYMVPPRVHGTHGVHCAPHFEDLSYAPAATTNQTPGQSASHCSTQTCQQKLTRSAVSRVCRVQNVIVFFQGNQTSESFQRKNRKRPFTELPSSQIQTSFGTETRQLRTEVKDSSGVVNQILKDGETIM